MSTYLTYPVCTLNWGGWVLEMPKRVNRVPGGHDKVPPMIGAMPLLNPRWNTAISPSFIKSALYIKALLEKSRRVFYSSPPISLSGGLINWLSVFHVALFNMAQRHVAFCKHHIALHERHVAFYECHVALHERHVAFYERHVALHVRHVALLRVKAILKNMFFFHFATAWVKIAVKDTAWPIV